MVRWIAIAVTFVVVGFPGHALAVVLNIDGAGQLLGARAVDITGVSYDVEFVEGACFEVFDGCGGLGVPDFAFTTADNAGAAAQALLDQVFIDGLSGNFDSEPSLTFGLGGPGAARAGRALTPYTHDGVFVTSAGAQNHDLEAMDSVVFVGQFVGTDILGSNTADNPNTVWAVWSQSVLTVPEPSTVFLLGVGLFGVVGYARRRR